MVKIRRYLAPLTRTSGRGNPRKFITLHETANRGRGANANAHARLQAGVNNRLASWHYQVDSTEIVQSFDDDVRCWHAGKQANDESIAIEICVNSDGDYEKALANAAALVAHLRRKHNIPWNRVVSHNFWTGKNCPAIMLSQRGRWDKFIAATNPGSTRPPVSSLGYSSPLPVGCRFTSGFATKARPLHMGADWGPIKPGQTGTPVFAPYEYTVVSVGRGNGTASARIPYHSGRYVFLDLGVHGGDRMYFYVGHLDSYSVRVGQKGNAGDQIGVMGGSGPNGQNDFAIHAHIGIAVNHNKPVEKWNAKTNRGWTDPAVWFRSKGITVGTTPPITHTAVDISSTAAEPKEGLTVSEANRIIEHINQRLTVTISKSTQDALVTGQETFTLGNLVELIGRRVGRIDGRVNTIRNQLTFDINETTKEQLGTGQTTWTIGNFLDLLGRRVGMSWQRIANIRGEVDGLKEILSQLAEGEGVEIDYKRVEEAARKGAAEALKNAGDDE